MNNTHLLAQGRAIVGELEAQVVGVKNIVRAKVGFGCILPACKEAVESSALNVRHVRMLYPLLERALAERPAEAAQTWAQFNTIVREVQASSTRSLRWAERDDLTEMIDGAVANLTRWTRTVAATTQKVIVDTGAGIAKGAVSGAPLIIGAVVAYFGYRIYKDLE